MAEKTYFEVIFRSGWAVWLRALLEIIVIAFISLIPLFGATLHQILPTGSSVGIGEAFSKAFLNGQLLFYSLGFIATIAWQCNKDFNRFFPLRTILSLYCIAGIAINSLVIGNDPTLQHTRIGVLAPTSIILFISSLVFYALMAVIVEVHVNVGVELATEDAELADAVRKSRGL